MNMETTLVVLLWRDPLYPHTVGMSTGFISEVRDVRGDGP